MNYLKITKELFDRSVWGVISLSEYGLILNLLNKVPFKETAYRLYGHEITLQPLEVCFSQRKMASQYNLTEYALRKMLRKFQEMKLITVNRRKLHHQKFKKNAPFDTTPSHNPGCHEPITYVTSITFCSSVIGCSTDEDENPVSDPKKRTLSQHPFDAYKNNVFKNINKKQSAGANAENQKYQNPWYSLDEFTNRTIHDSQAWINHLCMELQIDEQTLSESIRLFCVRQKNFGYNQMTKVVFTQQFINYFNKQKQNKKSNYGKQTKQSTVEKTKPDTDTELDHKLKDLAAKCRRFGGNSSGSDDV
ncbi:MAG: hypothetical protein ACRC26_11350 [Bacteroidales bacterium]